MTGNAAGDERHASVGRDAACGSGALAAMQWATLLEDLRFTSISRLRAAPATPLENAPSRRGRRSHGRLSFEASHHAASQPHAMPKTPEKPAVYAHRTLGFGVPATSDPHHFVVQIPRGNTAPVLICEHLGMGSETAREQVIDRVLLERHRWTAIRAEVQRAFNARLAEHNLATATWKVGDTPVDRLLGKELCVLAWAIERLDPEKIGIAVRNWLALRPEERWWMFGMTAMATGGVHDGDKGWRVALRYALGDTAQNGLLKPRRLSGKGGQGGQTTLPLFED